MIDQETEKITKFINEKWKNKGCYLCGENKWSIDGYVILPLNEDPSVMVITEKCKGISHIVVVCTNCGSSHFINTAIVGFVTK